MAVGKTGVACMDTGVLTSANSGSIISPGTNTSSIALAMVKPSLVPSCKVRRAQVKNKDPVIADHLCAVTVEENGGIFIDTQRQ